MKLLSESTFKDNNYEDIINLAVKIERDHYRNETEGFLNSQSHNRVSYKFDYSCIKERRAKKYYNVGSVITYKIGSFAKETADKYRRNNGFSLTDSKILELNIIFPDDEKFMEELSKNDEKKLFIRLVDVIENYQFGDRESAKAAYKNVAFDCVLSCYNEEFKKICLHFNDRLTYNHFSQIYERLVQVKYLNPELYNSYLNSKVKKI